MAVYVRRQLIPDLLSDLVPLPTPQPTTTTASAGLTTSSNSVVVSSDTAQSSSTASSTSAASSTASSTFSASIQTSSAIASSVSASSTTPLVVPTTTAAPTTSVDPSTQFVTSFTTPSPSPTASVQAAPDNSSSGFLQNKTLTSIVFSIVGVALLIIIVTIITVAFRRSRRKRLLNEAVSFDPAYLSGNSNINSTEKRRFSLLSSNSGHGGMHHGNYGGGYTASATAGSSYPPQDLYHVAPSESQYYMNGHQQHWYTANGTYTGN